MKKIFTLFTVAAIALSLTGCGAAATVSQNLTETKVMLSCNNFKVIGQAHGQAKATYVLGIGGLSRKALRNNAINEMSKNAKLTGAQTFANTTIHKSIKMITPLFVQVTYSATANIIEFQ